MMKCEEFELLGLDMDRADAKPEEVASAAKHAANCARCFALLESWRELKQDLRVLQDTTRLESAPARERDQPLRLAIESALSRLPERERTAFLLCEVEGLSHREAADILEVPEATSRTLLFRAKRQLQRGLSASGAFRAAEAR